jgi:hypothetical protein
VCAWKDRMMSMPNILCLCVLLGICGVASGIELSTLADICQAAENAINNISLEYEWECVPGVRPEDVVGKKEGLWKLGPSKVKLTASQPFFEHILFIREDTSVNERGEQHEETNSMSYNGERCKALKDATFPAQEGKAADKIMQGAVSPKKPSEPTINISPLGFTPLRLSYDSHLEPLSKALRREGFARLDTTPQKVNGFNAICADLLLEANRRPYIKVYFSTEHNYTLIRYEFVGGPDNKVYISVDVNSLQKVGDRLWFPSSGTIRPMEPNAVANVYRATSRIVINQDLREEVFDVKFPPGTRVADAITRNEYIVKPTQEQLDQSLPRK